MEGRSCLKKGRSSVIYSGEWEIGKESGHGTYYYSNGDRYKGNWKGGKQEGSGTYYFANGDRCEGNWSSGKQEGRAIYYYAKGDWYEGNWKAGTLHGEVILHETNGNIYVGHFTNNQKNGEGTLYRKNNTVIYIGSWKDDKKHGEGTHYDESGSSYIGGWENGNIHGKGILYHFHTMVFEGIWKHGEKDGPFTTHFTDGSKRKELWENDKITFSPYKKKAREYHIIAFTEKGMTDPAYFIKSAHISEVTVTDSREVNYSQLQQYSCLSRNGERQLVFHLFGHGLRDGSVQNKKFLEDFNSACKKVIEHNRNAIATGQTDNIIKRVKLNVVYVLAIKLSLKAICKK